MLGYDMSMVWQKFQILKLRRHTYVTSPRTQIGVPQSVERPLQRYDRTGCPGTRPDGLGQQSVGHGLLRASVGRVGATA